MEEWLKLAGQVTATGLLGFGLRVVWGKLNEAEKTIASLQEKRVTDQREWLKTATELSRLQHRAVRAIEDLTGRKMTPQSRP